MLRLNGDVTNDKLVCVAEYLSEISADASWLLQDVNGDLWPMADYLDMEFNAFHRIRTNALKVDALWDRVKELQAE